jgi:hypothetical protein
VDHVLALIGTPHEQAHWGVKCAHKDLCYGKKFTPMLQNALENFVADVINAKQAYNHDFTQRRMYFLHGVVTLRPSRTDALSCIIAAYA